MNPRGFPSHAEKYSLAVALTPVRFEAIIRRGFALQVVQTAC